jgi:Tfp pilus assembly protein PilX
MSTRSLSRTKQSGSTLIISLIVLAVLLLLGVTAMNTSDTQSKVAANMQYENNALNAAESNANIAENSLPISPNVNFAATSAVAATDPFVKANNANNYLIEFVSTNRVPLASATLNCTDTTNPDPSVYNCLQCVNTYLITAKGEGGRGATKVIQTYFSVPHC